MAGRRSSTSQPIDPLKVWVGRLPPFCDDDRMWDILRDHGVPRPDRIILTNRDQPAVGEAQHGSMLLKYSAEVDASRAVKATLHIMVCI